MNKRPRFRYGVVVDAHRHASVLQSNALAMGVNYSKSITAEVLSYISHTPPMAARSQGRRKKNAATVAPSEENNGVTYENRNLVGVCVAAGSQGLNQPSLNNFIHNSSSRTASIMREFGIPCLPNLHAFRSLLPLMQKYPVSPTLSRHVRRLDTVFFMATEFKRHCDEVVIVTDDVYIQTALISANIPGFITCKRKRDTHIFAGNIVPLDGVSTIASRVKLKETPKNMDEVLLLSGMGPAEQFKVDGLYVPTIGLQKASALITAFGSIQGMLDALETQATLPKLPLMSENTLRKVLEDVRSKDGLAELALAMKPSPQLATHIMKEPLMEVDGWLQAPQFSDASVEKLRRFQLDSVGGATAKMLSRARTTLIKGKCQRLVRDPTKGGADMPGFTIVDIGSVVPLIAQGQVALHVATQALRDATNGPNDAIILVYSATLLDEESSYRSIALQLINAMKAKGGVCFPPVESLKQKHPQRRFDATDATVFVLAVTKQLGKFPSVVTQNEGLLLALKDEVPSVRILQPKVEQPRTQRLSRRTGLSADVLEMAMFEQPNTYEESQLNFFESSGFAGSKVVVSTPDYMALRSVVSRGAAVKLLEKFGNLHGVLTYPPDPNPKTEQGIALAAMHTYVQSEEERVLSVCQNTPLLDPSRVVSSCSEVDADGRQVHLDDSQQPHVACEDYLIKVLDGILNLPHE